MSKYPHEWYLDTEGQIDMFYLDEGYHNGPGCMRCHEVVCHHCTRDWRNLECPVTSIQPTLFEENND